MGLEFAWYLMIGAGAGVLAGLLGIGGGLIVVPALMVVMPVPKAILAHTAIGTSLASIALTSISSSYSHHLRGAIRWSLVVSLAPGLALGALGGAAAAHALRSDSLQAVFALFLLAVAAQMVWKVRPAPHHETPGPWVMSGAGAVIGFVSGVVGIGGGTMTVPFLTRCNVPLRQAIAVSAACGFPIAVAGAAGFVMFGSGADLPGGSGYVYWPAFAGVAIASVILSPAGATLAHHLPVDTLRRIFAVLAAAVAMRMLVGSGIFA